MITYRVHPLATMFPVIDGPAFAELVDDIRENGLREPITLFEGRILDGRNRASACHAAGVEPRFIDWQPAREGDTPEAFVFSKNVARRMLNDAQRALCAARLVQAKGGGFRNGAPPDVITTDRAAKALNIPANQVRRARRVVKHATPDIIAAVENGTMTITRAEKIAAPTLKPRPRKPPARDEPHTALPDHPLVRIAFDWIEAMYERHNDFLLVPRAERASLVEEFAELIGVEITVVKMKMPSRPLRG